MNEHKPKNWGQDDLSNFVETAHQNALAIFDQPDWKQEYNRLRDINTIFHLIYQGWINPPYVLPMFFFLRAHASYLGSARLTLSAQRPEAYMVMRGCLEASMYGFHIFEKPSSEQIYLERDVDENSKKKARKVFGGIGAMFDALAKHSQPVADAARGMYEDCIYFGGHPNPSAIFGNISRSEDVGFVEWEMDYLNPSPAPLRLCLRNNAEVGLIALNIFGLIFPDRFAEVDAIRRLSQIG